LFSSSRVLFKSLASYVLQLTSLLLHWIGGLFTRIAQNLDLSRAGYLEFIPRTDDIFIATYGRSGTTWMQMILYQLTTDGSLDFPHISQVSPWFERVLSKKLMSADQLNQLPSPRLLKTHLHYKWTPKCRCKYIYVFRDGRDVAVSYYHFYVSHLGFKGTFSDFFEQNFMRGRVQCGLWFDHVEGWRANKDNLDILYLQYEDLIADLEGNLLQIIDFCGLDIKEERLPEIIERCSFDFMKKYENKFDHHTGLIWEKGHMQNSFLRKGKTGEGKLTLTAEQEKLFNQKAAVIDHN
jgi:Sulfotransferase domain